MRPVRKTASMRGRPMTRLPIGRGENVAMTEPDPVDRLRPGMRVVVRRRIEHGVTDALGDLVARDANTVSILTRRGLVVIDRTAVVAAKEAVSYTHLRAHETVLDLVCRLLLEKK